MIGQQVGCSTGCSTGWSTGWVDNRLVGRVRGQQIYGQQTGQQSSSSQQERSINRSILFSRFDRFDAMDCWSTDMIGRQKKWPANQQMLVVQQGLIGQQIGWTTDGVENSFGQAKSSKIVKNRKKIKQRTNCLTIRRDSHLCVASTYRNAGEGGGGVRSSVFSQKPDRGKSTHQMVSVRLVR